MVPSGNGAGLTTRVPAPFGPRARYPSRTSCSVILLTVIRDTENDYRVIPVSEWIENDESLEGKKGY